MLEILGALRSMLSLFVRRRTAYQRLISDRCSCAIFHCIQKNIEEKKLKDQLVFTNQSAARAATEEAELKKIIQEGLVAVDVELEMGQAYVTRKLAEKDLYVRSKKAEADLLVKLAEAEKVRLKNEALKGLGAERMVGLKMADAYKGFDVIILPSDGSHGVNPLNLDNALQLFDVRKGDKP